MKIWEILEQKGKLATIIGFVLGLVSMIVLSVLLIKNQDYEYIPFVISFGIAGFFFILPSSIKIKYKDFEFEVKD